jgi:hypothetical protein
MDHHAELLAGITEQMKQVLNDSEQAIYIYLDDSHKVCNKKLADLLGYASPKAWADAEAPLSDVVEEDQQSVIDAYTKASEKMDASALDVRVKNIKTGKITKTRLVLAPIGHGGHIFAAHFFTKI